MATSLRSARSRAPNPGPWQRGQPAGGSELPGEAGPDGAEPARVRLALSALEHEPDVRERAQVFGQAHAGAEAGEHQRDRVRDAVGEELVHVRVRHAAAD